MKGTVFFLKERIFLHCQLFNSPFSRRLSPTVLHISIIIKLHVLIKKINHRQILAQIIRTIFYSKETDSVGLQVLYIIFNPVRLRGSVDAKVFNSLYRNNTLGEGIQHIVWFKIIE